jgi:hypothetical protein
MSQYEANLIDRFELKFNTFIDEFCKENSPCANQQVNEINDYYINQHIVCITMLKWFANYFYRDFDESLMDESISQDRDREDD